MTLMLTIILKWVAPKLLEAIATPGKCSEKSQYEVIRAFVCQVILDLINLNNTLNLEYVTK